MKEKILKCNEEITVKELGEKIKRKCIKDALPGDTLCAIHAGAISRERKGETYSDVCNETAAYNKNLRLKVGFKMIDGTPGSINDFEISGELNSPAKYYAGQY